MPSITVNGGGVVSPAARIANFGFARNAGWFEAMVVSITPERVVSSGSSTAAVVSDANVTRFTSGVYATDFLINISPLRRNSDIPPMPAISLGGNLSVFSVHPTIVYSVVNGGADTLTLTTPYQVLNVPMIGQVRSGGADVDTFDSWRSGWMAKNIRDGMATAAATVSPPASPLVSPGPFVPSASLFSTAETGVGNAVRNTGVWSSSINLSGVSTWSSNYGHAWYASAVTPRHLINAAHIRYSVGATVWFCSQDGNNTRISRTVTRVTDIPVGSMGNDVSVITLSSDLPASINPMKVMPVNWENLKAPGIGFGIPFIFISQDQYAGVLKSIGAASVKQGNALYWGPWQLSDTDPAASTFRAYNVTPRYGDSGCPFIGVVNGDPVLISAATGPTGGTNISRIIPEINAILAIDGSYALSQIDLSGFNSA